MAEERNAVSRREFLKAAGLAAAGTVLGGAMAVAADANEPVKQGPVKVPLRRFGKTGVQVSCLALGGMFPIAENQLVLQQAINWGVTYWDTANSYRFGSRSSEEGIGLFFQKNPTVRKQIFLVTKGGARDPQGLTNMLNLSLERLQTDYIDLYFIHGVSNPAELNPNIKAWAAKAKADKKIRFFGFSTHQNMADCLLAAARLGWIDGIMLTYNFRIMHTDQMKAAVDACAKAGIGLTAMKTIGRGARGGLAQQDVPLLERFIQRKFTPEQAKLKAVWENPNIASICAQMPNVNLLASNVAAAVDKASLSAADKRALEQYAKLTESEYCAGCANICGAAVGDQVPVCDVMRCLMYYHSYGDHALAREQFAALPADARARMTALDYSAAERSCPNRLPIGALMKEATELLA